MRGLYNDKRSGEKLGNYMLVSFDAKNRLTHDTGAVNKGR